MWVTLAIVCVLVFLIWSLTGRRKGLPPGPTCYPIIGNVGLIKPSEAVKDHRRLRKIYGDFYSLMIFHRPVIFIHGLHNIRELLVKHGDVFSDRPKVFPSEVLAKRKGLAWSSGSLWKEQRTFALTTMRKFGFGRRCLQSQVMEEVDCLMEEFEKYEGQPFDIREQLKTSVSNVICSLLFGKRFDYEDAKFKRLLNLFNTLIAVLNFSSPAFIFPELASFKIFNFDKAAPIIKALNDFVAEKVEEHRKNFDENNINDYIDAYIAEQKRRTSEINTTFTDEQLAGSVRDFFTAGTETTSLTLRWALLYLIHYPEIQEQLKKDIDSVIGQGQPNMEHKEQLPRVEVFLLEVQRVANILPLNLPHTTSEDIWYKGYIFPKGAVMFFLIDSVLSDPEIFPEPAKFNPQRFLDENGKLSVEKKEKVTAFSTGRRMCLGEPLAKMELFLFLTRVLQRFDVKPENPDCLPSLKGTFGATNATKPFKLRLVKR
ncbi:cytochrome P450 2C20-like [Saccostrea echinata]|uniref:cytochrome P450 2C20-like n=1 Tax=Saccostrea echinata TaxID=191078 RepID=UPI002A83AB10|nr:cytochrome P450 2C20-like [Saccostrea echinata]